MNLHSRVIAEVSDAVELGRNLSTESMVRVAYHEVLNRLSLSQGLRQKMERLKIVIDPRHFNNGHSHAPYVIPKGRKTIVVNPEFLDFYTHPDFIPMAHLNGSAKKGAKQAMVEALLQKALMEMASEIPPPEKDLKPVIEYLSTLFRDQKQIVSGDGDFGYAHTLVTSDFSKFRPNPIGSPEIDFKASYGEKLYREVVQHHYAGMDGFEMYFYDCPPFSKEGEIYIRIAGRNALAESQQFIQFIKTALDFRNPELKGLKTDLRFRMRLVEVSFLRNMRMSPNPQLRQRAIHLLLQKDPTGALAQTVISLRDEFIAHVRKEDLAIKLESVPKTPSAALNTEMPLVQQSPLMHSDPNSEREIREWQDSLYKAVIKAAPLMPGQTLGFDYQGEMAPQESIYPSYEFYPQSAYERLMSEIPEIYREEFKTWTFRMMRTSLDHNEKTTLSFMHDDRKEVGASVDFMMFLHTLLQDDPSKRALFMDVFVLQAFAQDTNTDWLHSAASKALTKMGKDLTLATIKEFENLENEYLHASQKWFEKSRRQVKALISVDSQPKTDILIAQECIERIVEAKQNGATEVITPEKFFNYDEGDRASIGAAVVSKTLALRQIIGSIMAVFSQDLSNRLSQYLRDYTPISHAQAEILIQKIKTTLSQLDQKILEQMSLDSEWVPNTQQPGKFEQALKIVETELKIARVTNADKVLSLLEADWDHLKLGIGLKLSTVIPNNRDPSGQARDSYQSFQTKIGTWKFDGSGDLIMLATKTRPAQEEFYVFNERRPHDDGDPNRQHIDLEEFLETCEDFFRDISMGMGKKSIMAYSGVPSTRQMAELRRENRVMPVPVKLENQSASPFRAGALMVTRLDKVDFNRPFPGYIVSGQLINWKDSVLDTRLSIARNHAQDYGVNVLYVQTRASSENFWFDHRSMAVNADGDLVALDSALDEGTIYVAFNPLTRRLEAYQDKTPLIYDDPHLLHIQSRAESMAGKAQKLEKNVINYINRGSLVDFSLQRSLKRAQDFYNGGKLLRNLSREARQAYPGHDPQSQKRRERHIKKQFRKQALQVENIQFISPSYRLFQETVLSFISARENGARYIPLFLLIPTSWVITRLANLLSSAIPEVNFYIQYFKESLQYALGSLFEMAQTSPLTQSMAGTLMDNLKNYGSIVTLPIFVTLALLLSWMGLAKVLPFFSGKKQVLPLSQEHKIDGRDLSDYEDSIRDYQKALNLEKPQLLIEKLNLRDHLGLWASRIWQIVVDSVSGFEAWIHKAWAQLADRRILYGSLHKNKVMPANFTRGGSEAGNAPVAASNNSANLITGLLFQKKLDYSQTEDLKNGMAYHYSAWEAFKYDTLLSLAANLNSRYSPLRNFRNNIPFLSEAMGWTRMNRKARLKYLSDKWREIEVRCVNETQRLKIRRHADQLALKARKIKGPFKINPEQKTFHWLNLAVTRFTKIFSEIEQDLFWVNYLQQGSRYLGFKRKGIDISGRLSDEQYINDCARLLYRFFNKSDKRNTIKAQYTEYKFRDHSIEIRSEQKKYSLSELKAEVSEAVKIYRERELEDITRLEQLTKGALILEAPRHDWTSVSLDFYNRFFQQKIEEFKNQNTSARWTVVLTRYQSKTDEKIRVAAQKAGFTVILIDSREEKVLERTPPDITSFDYYYTFDSYDEKTGWLNRNRNSLAHPALPRFIREKIEKEKTEARPFAYIENGR